MPSGKKRVKAEGHKMQQFSNGVRNRGVLAGKKRIQRNLNFLKRALMHNAVFIIKSTKVPVPTSFSLRFQM